MRRGTDSRPRIATALFLLAAGAWPAAPSASAFPPPAPGPRFGSAIAVDPAGYFVTTLALVEGGGKITLSTGSTRRTATVVATDEENDVALLAMDGVVSVVARLGAYEADAREQAVFLLGVPAPPAAAEPVLLDARIVADKQDKGAFRIAPSTPVPAGFSGGTVVNRVGQVIGVAGPEMDGAGPESLVPFTGTRAMWGMVKEIPSAAASIPGLPMRPDEGAEGVKRVYGGSVVRVEFVPEKGKGGAADAAGKGGTKGEVRGTGEFPFGIPEEGLDLVQFIDGRALRCRAGPPDPKSGATPLKFEEIAFEVPKSRVARVFQFRDFDPAPANEAEKAKVATGLTRWKGGWVSRARAEELRRKAAEDERAREEDEDRSWEDRRVVESEHFRIESNLSARRLEEYAKLLESFRRHLAQFVPRGVEIDKVQVFLFRDQEAFFEFAKTDVGRISEFTAGYFVWDCEHGSHLTLFDRPGDETETVQVLLHEATHFFLHLVNEFELSSGSFPLWLNEGLAEYLGASAFRGGVFREDGVQDERLLWLQEMIASDRFIPLEDLFWTKKDKGFGLDHYAESWALVHFLMNGRNGAYRGAFKNYVVSGLTPFRNSDFDFYRSFLRVLQRDDFTKVTKEFQDYVKGLRFSDGLAYARRAGVRLRKKEDAALVEADVQEALRLGKSDPDTLVAVAGVVGEVPGRRAEAVEFLKRALAADPLDVRARRAFAEYLTLEEKDSHLRMCEALGR